jgi:hypothetical protein
MPKYREVGYPLSILYLFCPPVEGVAPNVPAAIKPKPAVFLFAILFFSL